MRTFLFFSLRIWLGLLSVLFAGCLPNSSSDPDVFELQNIQVDSISTTAARDTVTSMPVILKLWYTSGSSDCYTPADSFVSQDDSLFTVTLREKVFLNRACLAIAVQNLREIVLADSLAPGRYTVFANTFGIDTLRYTFFVD